ncbi:MAG: UDP-N-acetylglucosamine 2-epimerase [Parvicellaceae bacterium]
MNNLINEGFDPNYNGEVDLDHPKIYHCGDVMYDNSIYFSKVSDNGSSLINDLGLVPNEFILSTVHRNDNTDVVENLTTIFLSFLDIVEKHQLPIVLPLHPRTSKMMKKLLSKNLLDQIAACELIRIIPPTSFLDIIALEKNCRIVITDSGGVQKEAYFFKKPCVILRPQTEWIEIVETGSAVIADADQEKIVGAVNEFLSSKELSFPPVFGDGKAAEFIVDELVKKLN